ncbi:hypothetical protein IscW_ISCW007969 [Ixodes scapularis]|uniref:Secreted protein n=1 Tax=Ixodes scapularis TaxID=6945 RepID=B7PTG4_IXOSC|nr:hypothetical protein IscW_ISCW007969 [Ixodes scapularis]|eukprot:XP_002404398.1 hypothetical protein IscW_ISCW007969 [Ixodes scapularis]
MLPLLFLHNLLRAKACTCLEFLVHREARMCRGNASLSSLPPYCTSSDRICLLDGSFCSIGARRNLASKASQPAESRLARRPGVSPLGRVRRRKRRTDLPKLDCNERARNLAGVGYGRNSRNTLSSVALGGFETNPCSNCLQKKSSPKCVANKGGNGVSLLRFLLL